MAWRYEILAKFYTSTDRIAGSTFGKSASPSSPLRLLLIYKKEKLSESILASISIIIGWLV